MRFYLSRTLQKNRQDKKEKKSPTRSTALFFLGQERDSKKTLKTVDVHHQTSPLHNTKKALPQYLFQQFPFQTEAEPHNR